MVKSTLEIHHKVEGQHETEKEIKVKSFNLAIAQIVMLDITYQAHQLRLPTGAAQSAHQVSFQAPAMQVRAQTQIQQVEIFIF